MKLNIINGGCTATERLPILLNELSIQNITDYEIWKSIPDSTSVIKSINLSHKQIVFHAKENNLPEVCIAEDDIKFSDIGAYDYFVSNTPIWYDLYLGGEFLVDIENSGRIKSFTGMTLYKVSNRFYDTFLSVDNNKHIDAALENKGVYISCIPTVATQHNGYSSNARQYCNFDTIRKNKIFYNKNKVYETK